MLDYMVVYTSRTGNTKQVAKAIFGALPGNSKDICSLEDMDKTKEAKVYFVGFWVNRGSCEMNIIDYLGGLQDKKIALFGTCGMGADTEYYRTIRNNIEVWLPDVCEYLGCFLCQGKMPMQIRNKYESMKSTGQDETYMDRLIQNFDEALVHPDGKDLEKAEKFVLDCLSRIDKS